MKCWELEYRENTMGCSNKSCELCVSDFYYTESEGSYPVKEYSTNELPTGYQKQDKGKTGLAHLPTAELEEISKVLDYGAVKYGRDNWKQGGSYKRMMSACLRHIFAWLRGNDKDEETGLSHLAHAACCILFTMYYHTNGKGEDDRG